jgi:hypothetical protein
MNFVKNPNPKENNSEIVEKLWHALKHTPIIRVNIRRVLLLPIFKKVNFLY